MLILASGHSARFETGEVRSMRDSRCPTLVCARTLRGGLYESSNSKTTHEDMGPIGPADRGRSLRSDQHGLAAVDEADGQ